jgi:hypothetical protein
MKPDVAALLYRFPRSAEFEAVFGWPREGILPSFFIYRGYINREWLETVIPR